MAINPTMLIAMLAQQAPNLLNAFKKAYPMEGDNIIGGAGITSALDRGYDPGLIQQQFLDNATINHGYISPIEMTDMEYNDDINESDGIFPNLFPSELHPEQEYNFANVGVEPNPKLRGYDGVLLDNGEGVMTNNMVEDLLKRHDKLPYVANAIQRDSPAKATALRMLYEGLIK